jgi:autotransporter-associated beta strand protein
VDLTGHAADIAVSSLSIGERMSAGGSGGATGLFSFDTGTLSATTIYLATKGGAVTNTTPVSGTLNLGGGTVNVGSGGIIIASNSITGGNVVTGTLNLTGGTVKLGGDIVKGRASGGTATVTLDGGTLDLQGHNWGGAVAIDTNNFLSGTLKNVGQINNGASGLTKTGSGTLLLRGNNTYTGGTVVSAGTLGGDGSVSSAVTVSSAGTLQPGLGGGDTSTLTINNSLTLAGKAVFTLNRTDAQTASKVYGVSLLTLGGTLSVTNAGPPLQAGDTFKLFNGTLSGAFVVTNLPALAFTNLYWDVSLLNSQGIIQVASTVAPRPTIQPPLLSGTNLVLKLQSEAGFNYVLEATPALVRASWTGIQTNAGGGLLSFTVPINSANPANRQQFFRFRVQ